MDSLVQMKNNLRANLNFIRFYNIHLESECQHPIHFRLTWCQEKIGKVFCMSQHWSGRMWIRSSLSNTAWIYKPGKWLGHNEDAFCILITLQNSERGSQYLSGTYLVYMSPWVPKGPCAAVQSMQIVSLSLPTAISRELIRAIGKKM